MRVAELLILVKCSIDEVNYDGGFDECVRGEDVDSVRSLFLRQSGYGAPYELQHGC